MKAENTEPRAVSNPTRRNQFFWNKPRRSADISNVTGSDAPLEGQMKNETYIPAKSKAIRMNWLFDVEPYSRAQTETLEDVRDNLRLKKFLKRAVENEVAPLSLIETIRAGIRA
jgi:hypothetical protein